MPLTAEGIIYRDSLVYTQPNTIITFYDTGVTPETGSIENSVANEVARFDATSITQSFDTASKTNVISIETTINAIAYGIGVIDYSVIGVLYDPTGYSLLTPEITGTFDSTTTMTLGVNVLNIGDTIVYDQQKATVTVSGSTITIDSPIFPGSGSGSIYYANGVLLALQDVGSQVIPEANENITYRLKTTTAGT